VLDECVVAYLMNDEPLPMLNGFPVRLVVTGYFATYWVKSLTWIRVLNQADENFWMKTGYRVPDTPRGNTTPEDVKAGRVKTVPIERLRYVTSGTAPLTEQTRQAFETRYSVPILQAYGMTEAAHQMACNPLPPTKRIPGTVGLAAGPDVAIMDEQGNLLQPDTTGEIVIRGPNVTGGYENNPKANGEAFINGWFRTGDQGVMNAEGYISITGRLKEIISRGGEKISPREVDEVLMDHPSVQQVVTFGIPHEKLGEEVGAVIVLREGTSDTEKELREFVAVRLADFKVPRKILFMDEIPKGATGKLQRIGLAAKLGL
jgi:acyl-CoA synthetase (AMP-forming)/AMP-acid ligase II